jgi:3D (Asp-Asp-Asp) domain-containing protein
MNTKKLYLWIGESHKTPDGKELVSGTVVAQTTTVISFFTCVAIAFLLDSGFVFASDEGSATIGIVVFVAEGLGFALQQHP